MAAWIQWALKTSSRCCRSNKLIDEKLVKINSTQYFLHIQSFSLSVLTKHCLLGIPLKYKPEEENTEKRSNLLCNTYKKLHKPAFSQMGAKLKLTVINILCCLTSPMLCLCVCIKPCLVKEFLWHFCPKLRFFSLIKNVFKMYWLTVSLLKCHWSALRLMACSCSELIIVLD